MQVNKTSGWTHEEVIRSLAKTLNHYYVFPDIAKELGIHLEQKLMRKDYEEIETPEAFVEQITKDLWEISNDKHLKLRYTEQEKSIDLKISEKEQRAEDFLHAKIDNFGFTELNGLKGISAILICEVFTILSLQGRPQ